MPDPSAIPWMACAPETNAEERADAFETLISELAADFVAKPAIAIDDGIDRWLGRIVRVLGIERMTLVQLTHDASSMVRTHSYTVPGYQPLSQSIREEADVPWLAVQMRNRRIVLIPTVGDLPPEAARERRFMLAEGLKSNVTIPIVIGGDLIGWISFTTMSEEREWRPDNVNRLQLVTNVFASALRRKRDDFQLERVRRFEELISTISATFVQLPPGTIERALKSAIQDVVEFLGADRGTILTMSADRAVLIRSLWHTGPGIDPMPATLGTDYAWTFGKLCNAEPVVVSRVADLPAEAAMEREYFERMGVRSAVAVPLFLGDVMLGAVLFAAIREEVRWPAALVQRLLLLGGVFASALGRRAMEDTQRETLRFEQLIAGVSARMAAVVSGRVDEEITGALGELRQFFGADYCGLAEADLATNHAHIRYLACAAGIAPLTTDIGHASMCPLTYDRLFRSGETLVRSRMGECPGEDSMDREMIEVLGIRSILAIPIAVGERVRYCLGLASGREGIVWLESHVPRLRVFGDVLANTLMRTRSDEALRISEERFRRVVESAPNGVMMVDADGRIVMANPQFERMFGYREKELLGVHVEVLLPLRNRERHHLFRREYMADAESRLMGGGREFYGLRKNGTEIPVEIDLNPIETSEGRVVLVTVIDVTERKQADEALRASARSLAEAQRIARLGSWEWDVAAENVQFSEEAQRIIGVGMATFRDFVALACPQDRPEVSEAMVRYLREGAESMDLEFRIAPPDGGARIVRVRGRIFFGEDESPLRAVGTIQDVSEARRTEEETRELRTQLWHSDRIARTGTLTASLAHELNQPLTAILSNAQAGLRFLAHGNPDIAELREILADIVRDDKRAAAVIGGLRAMMRRKETDRESVELATVLNEILGLLHSELIGAGIELGTEFAEGCRVLGDRVQLQQVVLNLVMNAVEAMRDSKTCARRISISCRRADRAVEVRMQDTGPGISPERRESVFDAFVTTKRQGMGLGLAICRSIVESHGGRIRVEPGDGGAGATFVFELPAIADARTVDGDESEEAPG
ncbi:MAG: PAS domain S-box protein [Gammaproteobacteria bacterium]|nr:PAS domain S-box protein [Gammaproteobacteria bacterium]